VLIDRTGRIADTYRKLHLYDAFSYQESKRIKPGDGGLTVVPLGEMSVGLMTCYDIRFPEQARALCRRRRRPDLRAAGLVPGRAQDRALGDPPQGRGHREHRLDRRGRHLERPHHRHSAILDPMGVAHAFLEHESEAVVTTEVTRHRVDDVREFLPVLRTAASGPNEAIVDAH
jgi:predicted amidohydrolase